MEKVILATRYINCKDLTKDEFVKLMKEDLEIAYQKHYDIFYPIEFARHQNWINNHKKYLLKEATKYAEKKWKTENRRQEYINNVISNFEDKEFSFNNITFFDFDVNPGSNAISDNCIIRYNELKKLNNCFEEVKDNKYFKSAIGWNLVDYHGFRPQIELILPEEMENSYKEEEKLLEKAISNFYSNTTYFGD